MTTTQLTFGKKAVNDLTRAEVFGPVGYIATCLAHIRTGHEINLIEYGCIAVAPTQAEVDDARHMAETLADDYGQDDAEQEQRSGDEDGVTP